MSFKCPQCLRVDPLKVEASIEMGSDSRSDEISMQLVRCLGCDLLGLIVYEESRRGALDSESYDLQGWRLDPKTYQELIDQMKSCEAASNPRCECETHRRLGRRDRQGRWVGPPLPPNSHSLPLHFR